MASRCFAWVFFLRASVVVCSILPVRARILCHVVDTVGLRPGESDKSFRDLISNHVPWSSVGPTVVLLKVSVKASACRATHEKPPPMRGGTTLIAPCSVAAKTRARSKYTCVRATFGSCDGAGYGSDWRQKPARCERGLLFRRGSWSDARHERSRLFPPTTRCRTRRAMSPPIVCVTHALRALVCGNSVVCSARIREINSFVLGCTRPLATVDLALARADEPNHCPKGTTATGAAPPEPSTTRSTTLMDSSMARCGRTGNAPASPNAAAD